MDGAGPQWVLRLVTREMGPGFSPFKGEDKKNSHKCGPAPKSQADKLASLAGGLAAISKIYCDSIAASKIR